MWSKNRCFKAATKTFITLAILRLWPFWGGEFRWSFLYRCLFVTSHFADMKRSLCLNHLKICLFFSPHSVETGDCCLLRLFFWSLFSGKFRKNAFRSHLLRAGSCMTFDPERETVRSFLGTILASHNFGCWLLMVQIPSFFFWCWLKGIFPYRCFFLKYVD